MKTQEIISKQLNFFEPKELIEIKKQFDLILQDKIKIHK